MDERLVEIDFGPLEGLTPKQAALADRAEAERFRAWHRGDAEDLPGVESLRAATDRVSGVFDEVSLTTGLTLVVGHGYLGRLLIGRCVLGLPIANLRRLRLDPGRFAAVAWEGKLARLVAMNTVALTGLFQ